MIQAFSLIFNFFNIASPCSDMFCIYFLTYNVILLLLFYFKYKILGTIRNHFIYLSLELNIIKLFVKLNICVL
jgi:hypothetical protein